MKYIAAYSVSRMKRELPSDLRIHTVIMKGGKGRLGIISEAKSFEMAKLSDDSSA